MPVGLNPYLVAMFCYAFLFSTYKYNSKLISQSNVCFDNYIKMEFAMAFSDYRSCTCSSQKCQKPRNITMPFHYSKITTIKFRGMFPPCLCVYVPAHVCVCIFDEPNHILQIKKASLLKILLNPGAVEIFTNAKRIYE